jgi:response regulator RpfG family c-di-GMP phosphodiesterase
MSEAMRPKVLCVDDEARVVEGLALHLRREFEVLTALNGAEALERLRTAGGAAVVVSDMRMPGMDGAALLANVKDLYPDTTRILLTGDPGRDAVVSGVNKGQIFRFLTKPCPTGELVACVRAGVEQHRLVTAERVLLQQTLIGCIHTLTDVLALANPVAFGRASRLRQQVMAFAEHLGVAQGFWELEAAAMLSQIGYLSLPEELVEKIYFGHSLSDDEQALANGVAAVARRLLAKVPRLEPVLQILEALASDSRRSTLAEDSLGKGARILALVNEFDTLTSHGHSAEVAAQMLECHADRFGTALVREFVAHVGSVSGDQQVVQIPLRSVRPGMTILQDVRTEQGTLLVARGFAVTERFTERIRNFGAALLSTPIAVQMPRPLLARAGGAE